VVGADSASCSGTFYPFKVVLYFRLFNDSGILPLGLFHAYLIVAHILGASLACLCARRALGLQHFPSLVAGLIFNGAQDQQQSPSVRSAGDSERSEAVW
jgi:hypothetical protein